VLGNIEHRMDRDNEKQILEKKISRIDEQIIFLTNLRQKCQEELDSFKAPINIPPVTHSSTKELSPKEKITLFMSYFRGRDDVYAALWVNNRTGKRGYSPACKREWVRAFCRKPAVKCSECPNREFFPLDERAVEQHLSGKQVIGIYPMLENEHCYFLAIDFDKDEWFEDLKALKNTCDEEKILAVMERSHSGSGGHLWIFFSEAIPAVLARQLGSYPLTKTMGKRYQMDMKSYDRLFPNQDTMPKGGFGNLIALPLQGEPAQISNSLFIDDTGAPYHDQWRFLASVQKMEPKEAQDIVDEGIRHGRIINARWSPIDENDEPWMRLPSGKKRFKIDTKEIPGKVEAVLSNRIYIKTQGISPNLLNQLKHLAAFQNSEFYKKQRMRFSTHATPRIICCTEITDGYLSLPRGCLEDIHALLKEYEIQFNIEDKRFAGQAIDCNFKGSLNDAQEEALKQILLVDFGVFVAPPGSGKTVLAIAAIAQRKINVLIIVHRKPIMDQWCLQLSSLLGIDKKDVGRIGGGKNKPTGLIDVAMVQSLDDDQSVDDRIAEYGFVIVDECHHVSAFSFEKVLTQARARFVLGLTATPYRRDGHQPIIHMQCGPICHQIKQKDFSSHLSGSIVYIRETSFSCEWDDSSKIQDVWPKLIDYDERNQMIIDDVVKVLDEGRFPLILTERREHLERLSQMLKDKADFIAVLYGGLKKKNTQEIFDKLKQNQDTSKTVIVATGSYIGEGFDEPRLDTLFLTMPSSFKGKIVQYAGRLHRYHKDKRDVCIYDYVDANVSVLAKMFQKRLKTYKMLGYSTDGISLSP
jgi:superfamily II DNA or RNA helicase